MPILENGTDYVEDGQVTHTNLNALTEGAKFVKNGAGVANTGNTTDESTLDINASGELIIATADGTKGIKTAQINDGQIILSKMAANSVDSDQYVDGSIDNAHIASGQVPGSGAHTGLTSKIQTASIGAADFAVDAVSGQTIYVAGDVPGDTDSVMAFDASASDLKEMTLLKMSQYLPFPKCFGNVTFDTSTPTASGGYNVASVTDNSSTNSRRVNFTNDMADANYVVTVSLGGLTAGTEAGEAFTVSKATDHFIISTAATEGAGRYLSFSVFGAQAGYSA